MLVFVSIRLYQDESMSSIDFQVYHKREKDIYPSITFCFTIEDPYKPPWYERTLNLYDPSKRKKNAFISSPQGLQDYVRFLLGNSSNSNHSLDIIAILKTDYDDITLDMRDYLKSMKVESADQVLYEWPKTNTRKPGKTSYRHAFLRCFTFDISHETMPGIKGYELFSIMFSFFNNNSVFNGSSDIQLGIFMHYPNQLIRGIKLDHEDLYHSTTMRKVFILDNVEVIRRRNTHTNPCNEDYKKDDENIFRKLTQKTGCRPVHWPFDVGYPTAICTSATQMRQVLTPSLRVVDSKFLNPFLQPCHQIQTISYSLKEHQKPPKRLPPIGQFGTQRRPNFRKQKRMVMSEGNSRGITVNENLHITRKLHNEDVKGFNFVFQNPNYREILHVQSFNIESWIGNAGGYIGLFLGVAIWQIPDFIEFLFRKVHLW